jgi:L-ribulose-5-phosphate 3-epimerase
MKIGILLDSLKLELDEAVSCAARLGAEGVQFYASRGPLTPWNNARGAGRAFAQRCASLGLEIAAICGDLGGHGFERAEENPARVRKTCEIIDFALELGTRIVSAHIGVIPADRTDPIYLNMKKALSEVSHFAERRGAVLAVEAGPEPAARLAGFIEDCGRNGLGVNFDPANLVMVQGSDPVADFAHLAPMVVHVHAKDGIRKRVCDAKKIYAAFAENDYSNIDVNDYFDELPLGKGAVDFSALIEEMRRAGYQGYLTIEREAGNERQKDIAEAMKILKANLLI